MKTSEKLQEKRNSTSTALLALLNDSAERDLTADEQESAARMQTDLERFDTSITTARKEESREEARAAEERNATRGVPGLGAREVRQPEHAATTLRQVVRGEVREAEIALTSWPKGRDLRAESFYNVGASASAATGEGEETVSPQFSSELYRVLFEDTGVLHAGVRVITTTGGQQLTFRRKVTRQPKANKVIEAGTIGKAKASFDTVHLDAYKYAQIIETSRELTEDSDFDVESLMAEDLADAISEGLGYDLLRGSGTNEPNGLLTAVGSADVTSDTGVLGTPTYDNLVNLKYTLKPKYRRNCKWMMEDSTIGKIRLIKDDLGMPIWQPSMVAGEPDALLGFPIVTEPNMPTVALNAKSILFGDFSRYYVRIVRSLRVEWSTEFAWDEDLIAVKGVLRADGELMDDKAFALFEGAAS